MKILWTLWNRIDESEMECYQKNMVYILIVTGVVALAGAVTWLLIGRYIMQGFGGVFCCVTYPAVFVGLLGSVLYLFRHDFKN